MNNLNSSKDTTVDSYKVASEQLIRQLRSHPRRVDKLPRHFTAITITVPINWDEQRNEVTELLTLIDRETSGRWFLCHLNAIDTAYSRWLVAFEQPSDATWMSLKHRQEKSFEDM